MADAPKHVVYALTNGERAVYIGSTTNLEKRLTAHNSGIGNAFTRTHGGWWRVLYAQQCASGSEARCIEAYWTEHLTQGRRLPFIDFNVADFGPKYHGDHWHRFKRTHAPPRRSYADLQHEIRATLPKAPSRETPKTPRTYSAEYLAYVEAAKARASALSLRLDFYPTTGTLVLRHNQHTIYGGRLKRWDKLLSSKDLATIEHQMNAVEGVRR